MLTLPEKLFLLTIDEHNGRVTPSAQAVLRCGLASAVLLELCWSGLLLIEDHHIHANNAESDRGDLIALPHASAVLLEVSTTKKPQRWKTWVIKLGKKKLHNQIADSLVDREVLVVEKKNYRWFTPYPAAKHAVKNHLRQVVLTCQPISTEDAALLTLLQGLGLLKLVFTPDERATAKARIDELLESPEWDPFLRMALPVMRKETAAAVKKG
jgi:hypothetical protein